MACETPLLYRSRFLHGEAKYYHQLRPRTLLEPEWLRQRTAAQRNRQKLGGLSSVLQPGGSST